MKKKMYRKLSCIVLSAVISISLLSGCSSQTEEGAVSNESTSQIATESETVSQIETSEEAFVHDSNLNEPGEVGEGLPTICKETVSITIGLPQNPNVEDYDTNKQTLWLEKVGNYDITFKLYPGEEFSTQINLAATAGGGDLPDILLVNGQSDNVVNSWGAAGVIIPLNDYYENSAYYLPEAIERTGVDYYPQITAPDGNMYYVPQYNQSLTNEYGAKMWMYKPWLDKLDLDVPTTPEELREVLRAFTQEDPNGNGQADEIGLISRHDTDLLWFENLMAPFQYIPLSNPANISAWWDVNDGKVNAVFATDGYREGLKYLRSLFDEGLIDPLSFTNDASQTKALLTQSDTVIGTYVANSMSDIPASDPHRTEYVGVAPLVAEDGTQYTPWAPSTATPGGVITKNCENPEAAFRLLDYLVSEKMSIWTRWGEEGTDWVVPEEGTESMFAQMGYPAVIQDILPWGSLQNSHWYQAGPYIRQYSIALGLAWNGDETNASYLISTIQDEYTDKHPEEVISKLIYTEEEEGIVTPIFTSMDTYVKEMIANFCTNNNGMDINDDAVWQQYLDQLESIGLSQAQEIVQTVYDRMNG